MNTPAKFLSFNEAEKAKKPQLYSWQLSLLSKDGTEITNLYTDEPWDEVESGARQLIGQRRNNLVVKSINIFGDPAKSSAAAQSRFKVNRPTWVEGFHLVIA